MIDFFHSSEHTLLESLSQIFSLATPIILFIWFCYTQHQRYLANYCKELEGIYAGFVNTSRNTPDLKGLQAGIIMNIRDVDNKGFFKGEIEYGEVNLTIQNNVPINFLQLFPAVSRKLFKGIVN